MLQQIYKYYIIFDKVLLFYAIYNVYLLKRKPLFCCDVALCFIAQG